MGIALGHLYKSIIVSGAVWTGQPGRGPVCLGQAEGRRGELQHEHREGQRQPPGVLYLH